VSAKDCGEFGDRYVAQDGRQTWQPFEFKKATRLLQIVFRTGGAPVRVQSVSMVAQEYPVRLRGSFACSDETLTRLWRATIDTVYLHLEESPARQPPSPIDGCWPSHSVRCGSDKAEHFDAIPDRKGDKIHLASKRQMKWT